MCVNSEVVYNFVIATQNVKVRFVNTLRPLRVVINTFTHNSSLTGSWGTFRYIRFYSFVKEISEIISLPWGSHLECCSLSAGGYLHPVRFIVNEYLRGH